uniref:Protein kinase domain-containing protein n=1 Tax=Heterorhabditis bacteriophora TaxID=37862 RepID=A0A1I7WBT3_HETBA
MCKPGLRYGTGLEGGFGYSWNKPQTTELRGFVEPGDCLSALKSRGIASVL